MAVYVHHSKNGPDFHWDQGKIATLLAAVRFRQGRLLGRIEGMGEEFQAEAQEQVRILDAAAFKGLGEKDFARMLREITRDYAAPLTRERIMRWHSELYPAVGPLAASKGAVHLQVSITGGLDGKMAKMIHWVNAAKDLDPVIKAVVAQLWILLIRPFGQGNEQLGVLVTEMLMARANQSGARFYSIAGQLQAKRDAYIAMTKSIQKLLPDVTIWIEWLLGCIESAIDKAGESVEVIVEKKRSRERWTGMRLNDRQRMMLGKLLDEQESKITSSKWAMLTNTSQDTAGRDINDLVRRGVLVRREGGGRSTSYEISPGV
jgi:Fic family protein